MYLLAPKQLKCGAYSENTTITKTKKSSRNFQGDGIFEIKLESCKMHIHNLSPIHNVSNKAEMICCTIFQVKKGGIGGDGGRFQGE